MEKKLILRDGLNFKLEKAQPLIFRKGTEYFDLKKIFNDHECDMKSDGVALRVRNVATVSGYPTNMRLYGHDKMKASAPSWLRDYAKPVLTHHNSGVGLFSTPSDPIGRIHQFRFVSKLPKGRADSENRDRLVARDGTGYIELESDILDPDAIQKTIDGRYTTTSVGFFTDSLTCTICDQDWKVDGPCDHEPGRTYDKKGNVCDGKTRGRICLLETGLMDYFEQSFVNVPGSKLAKVTSFEAINNALEKVQWPEDSRTFALHVDSLQVGALGYSALFLTDKEVIEIEAAIPDLSEDDWVSFDEVNKESSSSNKQEEQPSKEHVGSILRLLNKEDKTVSSKDAAESSLTEATIEIGVDNEMATKAEPEKVVDSKTTAAEAEDKSTTSVTPTPSVDVSVYEDKITALQAKVDSLEEENLELAKRVKTSLADQLITLRIKNGNKSIAGLDADARKELREKYLTRTISSLEDAVADESESTAAFSVERGSVKPPTIADTSDDDRVVETKKSGGSKVSGFDYRGQIEAVFGGM